MTGEVILLHGDRAPFLTQQLAERWPPETPHAAQFLRGLSAYRRHGAAALPGASGAPWS
ncbi:MAG: hypothetical protein IRY94_18600 [Rhodospirillaceae bacterium]|nr:hypothetical protein [Rhodospirillaceae bacterium]